MFPLDMEKELSVIQKLTSYDFLSPVHVRIQNVIRLYCILMFANQKQEAAPQGFIDQYRAHLVAFLEAQGRVVDKRIYSLWQLRWMMTLLNSRESSFHCMMSSLGPLWKNSDPNFCMEELYSIPAKNIQQMNPLLSHDWHIKPLPLQMVHEGVWDLGQIEEYFFRSFARFSYRAVELPSLGRSFSLVLSPQEMFLCVPRLQNMSTIDACFVVHELKHLHDHGRDREKNMTPFESEKSALFSERAFLEYSQAGQIADQAWLKSNLFYPVVLIKSEIECQRSGESMDIIFPQLCKKHGLLPFPLSSLFECQLPFQFSTYCSAAIELVPQWKQYISMGEHHV